LQNLTQENVVNATKERNGKAGTGKIAFLPILLITLLCASPAFAQKVQIKNVAVVETELDEQSGAANEISRPEVRQITTMLRREAVKHLPRNRYNVMTAETVQAMGDAMLAECADENCIITLGSKIGADYIVRGIISKFQTRITLEVELYETDYGNLVASAEAVRSADLEELLEKGTVACTDMYKKFLESDVQARLEAAPAPTYTYAAKPDPKPEPKPESPPPSAAAPKPEPEPKQEPKPYAAPASTYAPTPTKPAIPEYKNFKTWRRVGAMVVNVVPGYVVPGLGSAIFMGDWAGAGIALAAQGGGLLLAASNNSEGPFNTIGATMFLSGLVHSAFIRPWYYKPKPKANTIADINPNGNFNFGVLPDKDGSYKVVVAYELSF
jgi:hypothetical protein